MAAKPEFKITAELDQSIDHAIVPTSVPAGKGGHVFAYGQLHRILDLKNQLTGNAAFGYSLNEKELFHLCTHADVKALSFKGFRTTTLDPPR